jgi:hypothetical protein
MEPLMAFFPISLPQRRWALTMCVARVDAACCSATAQSRRTSAERLTRLRRALRLVDASL